MGDEEERRIVRDLEAKVALERTKPIQVQLPDHGPYLLPRFVKVESTYIPDDRTFELFLETERGQRVRVPISGDQLNTLKLFVDHLVATQIQS